MVCLTPIKIIKEFCPDPDPLALFLPTSPRDPSIYPTKIPYAFFSCDCHALGINAGRHHSFHCLVWRVLRKQLYPYHLQHVQALSLQDYSV
jgi:hypothetical protein